MTPPLADVPRILAAAHKARLDAALDRQYYFDGQLMSLRAYLAAHPPIGKHVTIQTHTSKRVALCYEPLRRPRLWYGADMPGGVSLDVPKIVYDALDVPERTPGKMWGSH